MVACVATCVISTAYVPPRARSPADTNVTSLDVAVPPCVNSAVTPSGSALNAVVNFDSSKTYFPSLSIDSPASPGLDGRAHGTASVTARLRSKSRRQLAESPVSTDACFVSGSNFVSVVMLSFNSFIASTNACTFLLSELTSRDASIVTSSSVSCFNVTVTPGRSPLSVFVADVTV